MRCMVANGEPVDRLYESFMDYVNDNINNNKNQ